MSKCVVLPSFTTKTAIQLLQLFQPTFNSNALHRIHTYSKMTRFCLLVLWMLIMTSGWMYTFYKYTVYTEHSQPNRSEDTHKMKMKKQQQRNHNVWFYCGFLSLYWNVCCLLVYMHEQANDIENKIT